MSLLSFVLTPPEVHQSHWDGQVGCCCYGNGYMLCYLQWLNVRSDNVTVGNWKLIISELPHVYSQCSDCHLLGVAEVITDVFTVLQGQADDDVDDKGYTSLWVIPS